MPLPADPYGTDLAIDPSGDLVVTHSGSLGLVSGPDNCAQAIFLRLKTTQGDLVLHPEYGSQLSGRLVGAKTSIEGLARELGSELQTMLAEDPRFTTAKVVQIQHPASAGGDPDSVQIGVRATLAGGEQLTLENTSDPQPSDVSLPLIADPSIDPAITFDPLVEQEFFAEDSEFDVLGDLDTSASLADDSAILQPPTLD